MRLYFLNSDTGFVRLLLLSLQLFMVSCLKAGGDTTMRVYESYTISPLDSTDEIELQWSKYLYSHLKKRGSSGVVVAEGKSQKGLQILVEYDTKLPYDYAWRWNEGQIILTARNKESMLWLIYQFIANLGKVDSRFSCEDLPVPFAEMGVDKTGKMPYDYRSIYSPSNFNEDLFGVYAVGNIDFDWGLWGHNLHRAIGNNLPDEVYAKTTDSIDKRQYCFSSEELYVRISEFILNDYGDGSKQSARFVIMPNDNSVVCQCESCKSKGNTSKSATPAISILIARLAERFPRHLFFTSSYASVKEPPAFPMPSNVGVIISAMDLPFCVDFEKRKETQDFIALLRSWRNVCENIYVWDYCRNFDDYLTPYPVLSVMQQRLRFYSNYGVTGVFLNGSGEEYATFEPVQTMALAAMLVDPDVDYTKIVRNYYSRNYPKTGKEIADYYLSLEQKMIDNPSTELPIYGGIGDALKAYLDADDFTHFYEKIEKKSKTIKGTERTRLNKLLTALNFTRLELMRLPGGGYDPMKAATCMENLSGHDYFKDMSLYREAEGSLISYIANYMALPPYSKPTGFIECISHPLLTDGYVGSPRDYHTNWYITKQAVENFEIQVSKYTGEISLFCLHAPSWKIYLPQSVEVWAGERKLGEAVIPKPAIPFMRIKVSATYRNPNKEQITLRVIRRHGEGKITMACDEISL